MTEKPIHVYAPWISQEDVQAVTRVAAGGWISSQGPEVEEFEQELASFMGTKAAVVTMNGTTALHLAMVALRIGPGDEVLVPDLTFVAPVASIVATGARPVFCDVSPLDWTITPEEVDRRRTGRTKAVVVVHLYGNPADTPGIIEASRGALIIEDVAEAFAATRDGLYAGSFGDAGVFSFYANKIVTTGEGGAIATNDRKLAERMRFLRGHAMSAERRYYHPEVGWNYRMTAMQAAVGRSQLGRVEAILERKRAVAAAYEERLCDIPGIELHPRDIPGAEGVFWMYSIVLPNAETRVRVAQRLSENNIETRPFFMQLSHMPPYRQFARGPARPVSAALAARGLNLPSGPLLTEEEIDRVCDVIRSAMITVIPRPVMVEVNSLAEVA